MLWEAQLPTRKGTRGEDEPELAPDVAPAPGDGTRVVDLPEDWSRDRAEIFAALDEARLLQGYRLASLILRDRAEAEDATHEAIARAWTSWKTLLDKSRFDPWFDRILVNVCRNRMRHARVLHVVSLDNAFEVPAADTQGSMLNRLAIEPAFTRLTPEQRILVVLRYWRDLSVADIAERLGIPAGTVKSRLHYAIESLRTAIESAEEKSR